MLKIIGNIETIRAVEDTIRRTKKYEETVVSGSSQPIQGREFPTQAYTKILSIPVSPLDVKLKDIFRAQVSDARSVMLDQKIQVTFWYDNRCNQATIHVDEEEVAVLCNKVKGFKDAIAHVRTEGTELPSVSSESLIEPAKKSSGRTTLGDAV